MALPEFIAGPRPSNTLSFTTSWLPNFSFIRSLDDAHAANGLRGHRLEPVFQAHRRGAVVAVAIEDLPQHVGGERGERVDHRRLAHAQAGAALEVDELLLAQALDDLIDDQLRQLDASRDVGAPELTGEEERLEHQLLAHGLR